MDLLLKSYFTRQCSLFFLVFPWIFASCFFLFTFKPFFTSVWICGNSCAKWGCVWKGRALPARCSTWGRQAPFPAWDSDRCSGLGGKSSSSAAVADQGEAGFRLQWPPLSDLVSYPASDSNFLWRPGKVASKRCLCWKGYRLQYVSIFNVFQFWNEASEKRVHKQEKMQRIRICMWLPTFLWLLPELMLHRVLF